MADGRLVLRFLSLKGNLLLLNHLQKRVCTLSNSVELVDSAANSLNLGDGIENGGEESPVPFHRQTASHKECP